MIKPGPAPDGIMHSTRPATPVESAEAALHFKRQRLRGIEEEIERLRLNIKELEVHKALYEERVRAAEEHLARVQAEQSARTASGAATVLKVEDVNADK